MIHIYLHVYIISYLYIYICIDIDRPLCLLLLPSPPRCPDLIIGFKLKKRFFDLIFSQLTNPTQWQQSMERLGSLGLQEAFEFGPGGVLSKLMNKINPSVAVTKVE